MRTLHLPLAVPALALCAATAGALRALPTQSPPPPSAPPAEAAPGIAPGARVLLLRDGREEVFVVREVREPYARVELDLEWARDEEEHPLLSGLLERSERALQGLDRDELEGLMARLRRAQDDLSTHSEKSAEERVAVTRENALWVNFASVERYLVLKARPKAEADER